jgi:phosphomannomutase
MSKTLMVSVSGIRGIFGEGLTPEVLVRFTLAYGTWCRRRTNGRAVVVLGRDARVTGEVCSDIVRATLMSVGCDVIDAGLSTTPTVEMGVIDAGAAGGIVLSASHNPEEWNALKLLNEKGEFLSPEEGQEVIALSEAGDFDYATFDEIGSSSERDYLEHHIERILALEFIDPSAIEAASLKVLVDGINSVGAVALPRLLRALGIREENIILVNGEPTGRFAHVAEPLPENLTDTIDLVRETGADIGLVVDPDADRLALVADGGHYVSEELTQVLAADFLWAFRKGPFVTNLSSSRAIDDVAARHGQPVHRSAVGEINVVKKMQEVGAVLGGEGNGGVILPDLHHGRDALVGAAMILQHMAREGRKLSELVADLPRYAMAKTKLPLGERDPDAALERLAGNYPADRINQVDGLKVDLDEGWVHLRKSNTEPIVRIYAEGATRQEAAGLAERFRGELEEG